jgi:hypothetical protein
MIQYIDALKLIFVHIPKTGGSFIEKKLQLINKQLYNNNRSFNGHYPINYIINRLNIKKISKFNRFTVVRNPYFRIISAYNYLKKTKKRNKLDIHEWRELGSPSTISEFVSSIYKNYKNNKLSVINTSNWHVQQQYKFVVNNCENKKIICNILKYETLKEDFINYIERFKKNKIVYTLLYKHICENIKIKKDYAIVDILSLKDITMINEIYADDFSLFKYEMFNAPMEVEKENE